MTSEQEKRSRLIRSVSRGIRTPLNAVLGLTTLMNMTKDSEDMKQFARQIQVQVQKVMAVLEDSREERKPVDLGDCAQQTAGGAKRLEGVRVLLAEDGELNAEIIQKLLTNEGAACDRVADGLQALRQFEAAAAGTYEVILMDMQMPVMEGIEATKKIRNSVREDNDVPIFAMTANTFATDRKRCADAGMTRVYSETGELKRNSDDAGRESADGMRRITGRINNRKIWRRGSTALDCSGAFLWCIIGSKRKQGRITEWKLQKISHGPRNWKGWMCFFRRGSSSCCFRVSGTVEEKRRSGLSI